MSDVPTDGPVGPGDDLDLLAAEYVLGTLDGAAREQFEILLTRDETARRLVANWAERLQPLAGSVAPLQPPPHLWSAIEQHIAGSDRVSRGSNVAKPAGKTVVPFRPRTTTATRPAKSHRTRWIAGALAAAVAIILAIYVVPGPLRTPPVAAIAELKDSTGGAAHFSVTLGDENRMLATTPSAVSAPADKSYELWVVPKNGAPISLGVIDGDKPTEHSIDNPAARTALENGVTLAVSLEPSGGSPSGAPTGPVLFTGQLRYASTN